MVVLSGCSSSTPMKLGPDTYQVTESSHNIFGGGASGAQKEALTSANEHCVKLKKELLVKNINATFERPHNNSTVTFYCLNADDPELKRPEYDHADIIIKNK